MIFCCYWLFLFLLFIFQNQTWTQTFRESKYTFWALPTNYKMYTSPTQQKLLIHYQYFVNEKKLGEVIANDYFHEKLRENKYNSEFMRIHFKYFSFFETNSATLGNSYIKYLFDKPDEIKDFEDYLLKKDPYNYIIAQNYFGFVDEFKNSEPEFKKANRVKIIIKRNQYHISKEFIDENGYQVAYEEATILELSKSLE